MKKPILMLTLTAAVLASCTKGEINPIEPGQVPIKLYSTGNGIVGESNGTRAPYIGEISADNQLKALVLSSKAAGSYIGTDLHARGEMTFVGGTSPSSYDVLSLADASKVNFPTDINPTANFYLAGLYPSSTLWTVSAANVAQFTINGHEDLMAAAQVTTTAQKVKDKAIETLTFKHLLTKLEIGVRAVTNAAAGKWGQVTKIELVQVNGAAPHKAVEVNIAAGTLTNATPASQSVQNLYAMSITGGEATYTNDVLTNAMTLTEAGATVAYTMIAPFTATATATDLRFNIYTEVNGATPAVVNVPLKAAGPTAGNAYNITFTFSADDTNIQAAAKVIDWVPSGDIPAPVTK